jgi:lactoylglutathione lyase
MCFDLAAPVRHHALVTKPAGNLASAREVVEELFRRGAAGDASVMDELIAEDMVNHAAGLQGREGWKQILAIIRRDLGDTTVEHHHFVGDGDIVAHHMTMHGQHQASTMPLLDGIPVTGEPVAWTYIHLWRVANGKIVEHWACRDDVGLLRQVGAWPRT